MVLAAIIRRTTLTGTITQSALITAIDNAFTALGVAAPVYTSGTSGTSTVIKAFRRQYNALPKGNPVLQYSITNVASPVLSLSIAEDINTSTGVLTGATSSQTQGTFTATGDVDVYTVDHPEVFGVGIRQAGAFRGLLYWVRPAQLIASWDEVVFAKTMAPLALTSGSFRLLAPNPISASSIAVNQLGTLFTAPNTLTTDQDTQLAPDIGLSANGNYGGFSIDVHMNSVANTPFTSAGVIGSDNFYLVLPSFYLKGVLTP